MTIVKWFKDTGRGDIAIVGGKGANLGELVAAGIPVPPGFTVTAPVFAKFIREAGLDQVIAQELNGLDTNDTAQLVLRAERIRSAIRQASMPADVAKSIKQAYRQLGDHTNTLLVAVRSSATAEDLPDASFAGQQETFLNVNGEDDVVHAVQACWASLYNDRAIVYRQKFGFDHLSVNIAVVVQRMVQSDSAGVALSIDPLTRDHNIIEISAAYGLGEAVVSGAVTADMYQVNKLTWDVIDRQIASQPKKLVRDPNAHGIEDANVWQEVPPYLQDASKLTDEQIVELAKIVAKVEEYYGGQPQDIEWAIEGGVFYLTQARAETGKSDVVVNSDELPELPEEHAKLLSKGQAASPYVASGTVKVLNGPEECHLVEEGDILVAHMTTPDYVPAMERASAVVTNAGARICHAAIVAREYKIACVVGTKNATEVLQSGQQVTVDGINGDVFDGVAERRLDWGRQYQQVRDRKQKQMANVQTRTKVYAILADPNQASDVAAVNVDGIGLLRMEFMLANIGKHPRAFMAEGASEEYITRLRVGMEAFCSAFGDRPVVVRLLDFKSNELENLEGGSKYEPKEENPMLGLRGARRYMQQPEVFALELDAIRRVREQYKNLHVMVPFVRTTDELTWVLEFMASQGLERGEDFKIWMMAEVPSNVFLIEEFIACGIDGISIGSNDLTQLVLGVDRDSERLTEVGNELNPAVMAAMEQLVTKARARGVTVGICGQGPSDHPELTRQLIEWGATSVSVSSDTIAHTREVVHTAEQRLDGN